MVRAPVASPTITMTTAVTMIREPNMVTMVCQLAAIRWLVR